MKTLVLYVFHVYNQRVKHFIENAIFKADDVDFTIICNSLDMAFDHPDYVKVIRRENIGFDFGGWGEALRQDDTYTKYDNFIFINSSVSGPYLQEDEEGQRWTDVFLHGLSGNIRLYGPTINTIRNPSRAHVQSYAFCMDHEAVSYLLNECSIFINQPTFNDAIWKSEVEMSRCILRKGWNIGSRMKHYHGVDFTFSTPQRVQLLDDVMYPQYLGFLFTKEELLFIKGNRCGII
jgi:hypothetical protein